MYARLQHSDGRLLFLVLDSLTAGPEIILLLNQTCNALNKRIYTVRQGGERFK